MCKTISKVICGIFIILMVCFLTACKAPGISIPANNANQPSNQTSVRPGTGTPLIQLSDKASLGNYLVALDMKALYYRTNDSANQSNCYGACASTWPPFLAFEIPTVSPNITGTVGLITRTDGTRQVTYNGWPLYYYSGDVNLGDTNGQGLNNVWFVATPTLAPYVQVPIPPINSAPTPPAPQNYNYGY